MVSTVDGIHLTRNVRRMPIQHRWTKDTLNWVRWAPWRHYKDQEGADGEVPEGVPAEERDRTDSGREKVVYVDIRERPPRDFQISKKDAEKYEITRGCPGCSSFYRGLAKQAHTPECRERFRTLMEKDAKVINYNIRKAEYAAKLETRKEAKKGTREKRNMEEDLSLIHI